MMLKKLERRLDIGKIICEYVGHRCFLCEEYKGIPTKILEPPWWQYVCVVCGGSGPDVQTDAGSDDAEAPMCFLVSWVR